MSSMTFLPKEFSSSNEGSRVLEFPSDNVSPLIKAKGKISVRVNPFGVTRVHDGFTCGSDSDWLR
jgi:hypothetical protein